MFKITRENCFFGALVLTAVTLSFSNLLINTLSIWLLIVCWILVNPIKEKIHFFKTNKLIWLFSSLFIIYVIGLIYGDFKLGLFEIEKRLSLLIFPIVLGTAPKIASEKLKIILVAFALSCIVVSIICLIDTFYTNYLKGIFFHYNDRFFFDNLTQKYGFHPSYFSMYAVFSIFILIYYGFKNGHIAKLGRLFLILIVFYLVTFIFIVASRIGLISLSILFISTLLVYFYKKRKLLSGVIITLFFSGAIFFSLQFFTALNIKFKGLIHLGTENMEYSGSGLRLDLWKNTMIIIKNNLILGVGTGNMQPAIQNVFKTQDFSAPYQNFLNPHNKDQLNSHNQFLDITGTLGIIGLLFFLWVIFYPLYIALQNKNYLYTVFLLLFVFLSLVEVLFAVQKGVVWYSFFNSLFAFHSFKKVE